MESSSAFSSPAQRLDAELYDMLLRIEGGYTNLSKHQRIRVERWVERLSTPTENVAWKRNTNAHARLLLPPPRVP